MLSSPSWRHGWHSTDSGVYLLRLEVGPREGFRNPASSCPCLCAAAAAGIAPAVHHADEEAGVVLMDFMVECPLTAFPGGEPALLRTLGEMVVRLQATTPFPPGDRGLRGARRGDAESRTRRRPGRARRPRRARRRHGPRPPGAPGVLDGHVAGVARVRAEYPWADAEVSAHNDINPRNVLFDGERLWLVDWELAYRNDPLADVATIANGFSEVPDVETFVLESWLGRSPDDNTRRRLTLVRSGGRTHRTDARRVPRPRSCVASYGGRPSCSSWFASVGSRRILQ